MCTRYISPDQREIEAMWHIGGRTRLRLDSGVDHAAEADSLRTLDEADMEREIFPARMGYMVQMDRDARLRKMGKHFALVAGQFGLIAHWVRPDAMKKMTRACYNARTETVHEKPSYRTAWKDMNWCVIPAKSIYEPCYESGRAVPWRISRADGRPLWIAGICWAYKLPDGKTLQTYSMLTIDAEDHALFRRMHEPGEEKRMVVILKDEDVEAWLNAETHDEARSFFTQFPADELVAEAASDPPRPPRPPKPSQTPTLPKRAKTPAIAKDKVPLMDSLWGLED
jgi:putative SOS response-associated peptidase YedK